MHAKRIRRDRKLLIHDVPDIHWMRHDLSPLLDVHDIEEMRRRRDHSHTQPDSQTTLALGHGRG